jgi:lipoprotein-anchoring transpeptidase ErfK/SrfK
MAVMAEGPARPARTALVVGLLGAAILAASLGLVLTSNGGAPRSAGPSSEAQFGALRPSAPAPRPSAAAPRPSAAALARQTASPSPSGPTVQVAKSTLLATVRVATSRYTSAGQIAVGTVPATWYERPSVLPVVATKPGWVEVRLAQRPNESTAWVPASDVTLSETRYEIVVHLATTRLSLYENGQLVFSAPAGVGTPGDPTPTGQYFVAFQEQPPSPNPGYGPFILVTSAHSPAISNWEGSGDAIIGIHGPLGEDSQIGTSGARISHGCIRLHDQALEGLTAVPAGTPIDIVG